MTDLAAETTPAMEALLALHDRARACTACPLHKTRTQAVPGYGLASARIMAVGEAPGQQEDKTGRPFVGPAGQLLTKLLESVGLSRRDIYICNVLKCRPPNNRDPELIEVAACAHFLDEQIELIQPEVILILGRHALTRLLPSAGGISHVHGQRIMQDGRVYMPLYHPAAALHNGSLLATLQDDMYKVKALLDDPKPSRNNSDSDFVNAVASSATQPKLIPPQMQLFDAES